MDSSKYPFDFASMQPGDIIDVEVIERLTDTKRDDREYWRECLKVRSIIIKGIMDFQGWEPTVKSEGFNLRILMHNEASKYNPKRRRIALRQVVSSHRRMLSVDTSGFNAEELASHRREIEVGGAMVSAIRETAKIALAAAKRPTPGLVASK